MSEALREVNIRLLLISLFLETISVVNTPVFGSSNPGPVAVEVVTDMCCHSEPLFLPAGHMACGLINPIPQLGLLQRCGQNCSILQRTNCYRAACIE
jgi:hypothetical protein